MSSLAVNSQDCALYNKRLRTQASRILIRLDIFILLSVRTNFNSFHFWNADEILWLLLGRALVDTRLPFGSRSSPFIFYKFADALLWILTVVFGIPFIVHYLDDYFLCSSSKQSCQHDMDILESVFSELGVPLAPDKVIGPVTKLTYLGIEIDSVSLTIRLPVDKMSKLSTSLKQWSSRKKCTKRELLSLIGSLSFA